MIANTISVPVYDKEKRSTASYLHSSDGTDYLFIIHGGESIKVRVDQLWFWTDEFQTRHEEAIADLREGRYSVHETGDHFLAAIRDAIAHNEVHSR